MEGVELNVVEMFPFLSFPTELRLKAYTFYLQNTVIRIPGPPIPNTLALLSTCRTIYQEASPQVISTATFSLWSTKDMIRFLGSLSEHDIRSLRHLVVCGDSYGVFISQEEGIGIRLFHHALPYFPGLQLDTLTVHDDMHGPQFDEVMEGESATMNEELFLSGNGWRELRFFSPNRAIVNTMGNDKLKEWGEMLDRRDGETSGANLQVLVAKKLVPYIPVGRGGQSGFYMKDITMSQPSWELIDENSAWREEDYVEYDYRRGITRPTDQELYEQRPVVIVVRRGETATYVEGGGNIPEDFRNLVENHSWKEIREKKLIRRFTLSGDMEELMRNTREQRND